MRFRLKTVMIAVVIAAVTMAIVVEFQHGASRSPAFILWGMPVVALLALAVRIPFRTPQQRPNADASRPSKGVPRWWE